MNFDRLNTEIEAFQNRFKRLPIIWAGASAFHLISQKGMKQPDSTINYQGCEVRLDKTLKNNETFIE